jgi:HlyD family secretion protein
VHEGQAVRQGQILVELAAAVVHAQERALSSQHIGLLAQRARLRAEQLGQSHFDEPDAFASLRGADRADADHAMRLQSALLRSRLSLLATQRSALSQRVAQAGEEGLGYRSQLASTAEQERLLSEEIEALNPLVERGFVSKTRMRALERAKADLQGRRGQYGATAAQVQKAAGEARLRVVEAEQTHLESVTSELRDVEAAIGDLQPRLDAVRDQLARTKIRAPQAGTVVGLSVFTVGGVIAPGQTLMDIVPKHAPLLVEARISPDDADDLSSGQRTLVRFPGLHLRSLADLEGTVTRISADSFVDQRTGEAYFSAEIMVQQSELLRLRANIPYSIELRPGMPVEIMIPLRKRTALQYVFEPLLRSVRRSLSEQ